MRNYDPNIYTHRYYSTDALMNTWQGQFEIFGKEEDWPEYHGETIIPDKKLVQRGRRKHTRHDMMMDRMRNLLLGPLKFLKAPAGVVKMFKGPIRGWQNV